MIKHGDQNPQVSLLGWDGRIKPLTPLLPRGRRASSSMGARSRSTSGKIRASAGPPKLAPGEHRRLRAYAFTVGELADEQRHLDATGEAYDLAFAALTGRGRASGIDEFANEALEQMRRERIRVYTEGSGPLYFGRIDGRGRCTSAAMWSERGQPSAVGNWRAPAAEPFYTATAQRPTRPAPAASPRYRGPPRARVRRRGARTGGEDHLTEAIVEDITRRRVGEMRQIIATITPRQYQMIPRGHARARHPGRSGHGEDGGRAAPGCLAAVREPRAETRGRARRRGQPDLHPLHRAGAAVLREVGVEQRARRADLAPAPGGRRGRELATLKGSGRIAA